jgi:2-iminobutanoate/2-iminopropanoate deaminase
MKISPVTAADAPKAIGPYSQAMFAEGPGQVLYTSGQIALDPVSGEMVQGGIEAETRRVLANLEAILQSVGMEKRNVIKTTVFLKDLSEFQAMNAIYETFFEGHKPARSTVEVSNLPRGARIEIEAIAIKD